MCKMNQLPAGWTSIFERRLDQANLPQPLRQAFHKWAKFYLCFCQKFGYPATAPTALGPFLTKLAQKKYSIDDRHHAATAVRILLRYDPQEQNLYLQLSAPVSSPPPESFGSLRPRTIPADQSGGSLVHDSQKASWEWEYRELETEIKLRNYSQL